MGLHMARPRRQWGDAGGIGSNRLAVAARSEERAIGGSDRMVSGLVGIAGVIVVLRRLIAAGPLARGLARDYRICAARCACFVVT